MDELFEPIGEALVINGITDYNPEIQLYLFKLIVPICFVISLTYLITLWSK